MHAPEIDEQARALIRRQATEQAAGPLKAWITALYAEFDRINAAYFDDGVRPVAILLTPPASARSWSDASQHSGYGGFYQLRLRPALVGGFFPRGAYAEDGTPVDRFHGWRMRPEHPEVYRRRLVFDLLLRETVRVALLQRDGELVDEGYGGFGPTYAAEANRVGDMLGLPAVVARNRKGKDKLPICSEWPLNVRPGGVHGDEPCDGEPWYGHPEVDGLWEFIEAAPKEEESPLDLMLALWDHKLGEADRTVFCVTRVAPWVRETRPDLVATFGGEQEGGAEDEAAPPAAAVVNTGDTRKDGGQAKPKLMGRKGVIDPQAARPRSSGRPSRPSDPLRALDRLWPRLMQAEDDYNMAKRKGASERIIARHERKVERLKAKQRALWDLTSGPPGVEAA